MIVDNYDRDQVYDKHASRKHQLTSLVLASIQAAC
jgi:hypothetical protein